MLILAHLGQCIKCASPTPYVCCDVHIRVKATWKLNREGVHTVHACDECEPTYHSALVRECIT